MDQETPEGTMASALEEVRDAARVRGIVAMETPSGPDAPVVLSAIGPTRPDILAAAAALMRPPARAPVHFRMSDGTAVIACPWTIRPRRRGGLVAWRRPDEPEWDDRDHPLMAATAALVRTLLENGPEESGIDRLTGLPNRAYFLDEAERRIERLIQDRLPGTLMVVSIDDMPRLSDMHGRDARNGVVARIAGLLRAMVRPADLVARIGRDDFAIWLDGMDHMTAAERAEAMCGRRLTLPEAPGRAPVSVPGLSIGIASRAADSTADIRDLMPEAREASQYVRREGGGGWHVARLGA